MVGLDIGSKTIKIVEIDKEGGKFVLKASGAVGYTGISLSKIIDVKTSSALAGIVKKLHKEARVSSKDVAIAIPENKVFTRTINFPMLTDTEVASAVKWEAEQYIPIPINEAVIQHTILERNEKATPPSVTVLLIAAPRSEIEKYVNIVAASGLNVVAVETELLALSRALAIPGKTVMLVDMGSSSTDMAIVKDKMLSFSRSIPVAGDALTRSITQGLAVSSAQAEQYKNAYGLVEGRLEGKIRGAMAPVFKMIIDEIKKAIHFYESENGGSAPDAVIVGGGTTGIPGATAYMAELLGLEVAMANPFVNLSLDPQTAKSLNPYAPIYAIATGLAMRES